MKFMPVFAPVAIAGILALTGCGNAAAPAPTYTPAAITVPAPISKPAPAAVIPAAPMDTVTAPKPAAPAAAAAPAAIVPEAASKISSPKISSVPPAVTRCEEDMPCWDCHTMGNKICGPLAPLAQEPLDIPLPANVNAPGTSAADWLYDCDTTGYKLCKGANLGDAWESFDAAKDQPIFNDAVMLEYVRTAHKQPTLNDSYYVVKSTNLPKTWHIFHYSPTH